MYIYKITNNINHKVYIGQTNNVNRRIKEHLKLAKYNINRPLYNDINIYGFDNFSVSIIDSSNDFEELNCLEKYYIKKYNSNKIGYNIQLGGNSMYIKQHREKHDRISKSKRVRKQISDTLKIYRKSNPFSEEHRNNLRKSMMGNHNFGNSDTRSIECWCIDSNGIKHSFHNYKCAGKWWYENYNPFNSEYNYATFRRKIIEGINYGYCYFGRNYKKIKIDNIKWYNT